MCVTTLVLLLWVIDSVLGAELRAAFYFAAIRQGRLEFYSTIVPSVAAVLQLSRLAAMLHGARLQLRYRPPVFLVLEVQAAPVATRHFRTRQSSLPIVAVAAGHCLVARLQLVQTAAVDRSAAIAARLAVPQAFG